nr:immunoglobulin heavy chain junction region [Macaca mulatta]MOV38000.1 immunoglobulin heavy chain junction region [Macaca mulatta]MOV38626.1 immunoglobulin heavy chain junction region [Macaca mulatta]MOV38978.1 immunoglobulin heavy chain junction region [Macaca mulatta]MOV39407.1 immunoglobulin heavy chain junction region [Macaca mulatta]
CAKEQPAGDYGYYYPTDYGLDSW